MGLCVNILGVPLIGDKECADRYRDDRTERIDIRQGARSDRTEDRQQGRTDRTQARCADGSCGADATIGSIGGAIGSVLGGATSGLLGSLPLIIGGVAVVGVGVFAYSTLRKK